MALSLSNLADSHRVQGRYAKSEALHKRSLSIYERTRGPEHPDVALSLNNLATLYVDQGRCAEAEPLREYGHGYRETRGHRDCPRWP